MQQITASDLIPCLYRFLNNQGFEKTANMLKKEASDVDFENVLFGKHN